MPVSKENSQMWFTGDFGGLGGENLMRCMVTIGLKYHFQTPLIIGPGKVVIHNSPNFGSPTLCLL